ncbi:MAG: nicotinate phosphoribosyltransferase, partial [Campylobacter sp.]|nr:nicotinate phosphoribosyltransferase [Campylobacter sp.]
FYAKKLLEPLFINGEFVGKIYSVNEIAEFAKSEKESIWDEFLRNIHPQTYKVDLSKKLYELRENLINEHRKGIK